MSPLDLAKSYLYDAHNQTDHAAKLVRCAQGRLDDGGDVAGALEFLRQAMKPAEDAPFRIRWAIEKLEAIAKKDTP